MDETDEAYDEGVDESDEAYDEAMPRIRFGGRVQTAPRQTAYRPRPNNNFVTQTQLQAALGRVSSQIAVNSNAIKTVESRVRSVSTEQVRITGALRKEVSDRKKEEESLRKELQSTRELAVILPLLGGNPLIRLLALGGGSFLGGGGSGSGDSTGNLLILALAFGALG